MNEDYDAAKIIKSEIDKIKAAMFNPWVEELIQSHMGPQKMQTPMAQ